MRKYTAIALFLAMVTACKKESSPETKIDPATGKTVPVQAPTDKTEKAAPTIAENPAIKESGGIYTQTFKLKKGQTYPLTTYTRNVQTVTNPEGKSVSGTSESTDEMSFTVNDFQNGVYDITVNLLGKRSSETMNGKTMVVDTRAAAPADQNLKIMWNVNRALTGNTLKMKLKENGEVVSITGFEPIYTKVLAVAGSVMKDEKQKQAFAQSFKQSFGEISIKDQFAKNLMVLPAKGAKIGEKWTESENASPDGKVKLSTTMQLKNVENGTATISVSGGIPYKSDRKSQGGMTHAISSELLQSGTVSLDQMSGWIKNQNVEVKTTQTESLSDGKKTQTMKSVATSTVMVNPSK